MISCLEKWWRRTSVIQEGLRVELLLLYIERNQLGWFGHLTRKPAR